MIAPPSFARAMAASAGVAEDEIASLWTRHIELVNADPGPNGAEYGGRRWKGLVDDHVKRARIPTIRAEDPVMAASLKAEREAKIVEENEYLKTAVSLKDWLGDLRTREDFLEPIAPWEAHIASFRDPYANESAGDWLYAALDGYGGPTPEAHLRRRKV